MYLSCPEACLGNNSLAMKTMQVLILTILVLDSTYSSIELSLDTVTRSTLILGNSSVKGVGSVLVWAPCPRAHERDGE